jgi:hypothetical protein
VPRKIPLGRRQPQNVARVPHQVAGPQIEAPLPAIDRVEHHFLVESVAAQQVVRVLHARPVLCHEQPFALGLVVERRARVGDGRVEVGKIRIQLDGVVDRALERLARIARIAEDEEPERLDAGRAHVDQRLPDLFAVEPLHHVLAVSSDSVSIPSASIQQPA